MSQDIRFLYLRDSQSNRVVTIARRLNNEQENVEFSYSVNRPSPSIDKNGNRHSGDQFSKALGRHIAQERLLQGKSFSVPLDNRIRAIDAVIMYLAYEATVPNFVSRIARKAVADSVDYVTSKKISWPDYESYNLPSRTF